MPNENSGEGSKLKIESKILIALLDNGGKRTGQIAKELGYINEDGRPLYKNILPALKRLKQKKILRSEKRSVGKGAPPTFWWIEINNNALMKLVNEYPECISSMQSNENIIEFLCNKHINYFPEESHRVWKGLFKEMTKTSPSFFKVIVNKTIWELIDIFYDSPYVSLKIPKVVTKGDSFSFNLKEKELIIFPTLYEIVYQICVGNDLIEYGRNQQSLQALAVLHRIEEMRRRIYRLNEMEELIELVTQIAKLIELNSSLEEIVKCLKEFSQSLNRLKTIEDLEVQQEKIYNLYSETIFKIKQTTLNALIEKGFNEDDIINLPSKFCEVGSKCRFDEKQS